MNTEDLIRMLATGAGAVEPNAVAHRYSSAIGWGALAALLLMMSLLGLRPDLGYAMQLPMFWVKLAFAGSLSALSVLAAVRLSRPGVRLAWLPVALAAPLFALWALAAIVLGRAEPALRGQLFFGQTWKSCPFLIAMLSVPLFIGCLWAMKGLAPTRLRLAGAAAGLAAGTSGAVVYCLHCPEMEAPFLGFWYVLGMLIPAAAGALVGPSVLRW